MIYISCMRRSGGDRIALIVCEKVCGGCPDYDEFCDLLELYIELFWDEKVCPACGGTGVTESDYSCPLCGRDAPWRLVMETELAKKQKLNAQKEQS